MNNETLERDLCSRLMNGVKVYLNEDVFELTACTKRGKFALEKQGLNKLFRTREIEDFIPILFSTSCLTKPIRVSTYNDGKPFVPIEEMRKLSSSINDHLFIDALEDDLSNIDIRVQNAPFVFVEFWNKTHINYRLSPDKFIEATNEYE